jgi:hypothetical protein
VDPHPLQVPAPDPLHRLRLRAPVRVDALLEEAVGLRPDAQGQFGRYRLRGVEIDGNIEGRYHVGSGYQLYEPPE